MCQLVYIWGFLVIHIIYIYVVKGYFVQRHNMYRSVLFHFLEIRENTKRNNFCPKDPLFFYNMDSKEDKNWITRVTWKIDKLKI